MRASKTELNFAPPPEWANVQSFQRPDAPVDDLMEGGLVYWLVEDVVRLVRNGHEQVSRQVKEVVGAGGLQAAAALEMTFNPSFEELTVHHVTVTRAGATRQVDVQPAIQLMRREADLERATYDGRLTAHLVIPDVRVGDLIETCFSINGSHPIHGDRFSAFARFQWAGPVHHCRYRVIAPAGRTLSIRNRGRAPDYEVRPLANGQVEHVWSAREFPGFRYDPDTPPWWTGHSQIWISDAMTWADVSDVFRAGYAPASDLGDEIGELVRSIEVAAPDVRSRIALALKRIQHDVRYLAVSIGTGGVVPRPPDLVWSRRSGDCKDVSRLLSEVLRRLGVDASPALVDSDQGWDLEDSPPSIFAFNHCIVRVRLDEETYWLEPTRPMQGGSLEYLVQPRYGWALPLTENANLEWMGEDSVRTLLDVTSVYTLGRKRADPGRFTAETTYRGWRADQMRRRLSDDGPVVVERDFLRFCERRLGPMEVDRPLEFKDDEVHNELTTIEAYRLLDPWRETSDPGLVTFTSLDEAIYPNLILPSSKGREQPLYIGSPGRLRQHITIEPPGKRNLTPWAQTLSMKGIALESLASVSNDGRRLELKITCEISKRVLADREIGEYAAMLDRFSGGEGVTLTETVSGGEFARSGGAGWLTWLIVTLVGLTVFYLLSRNM